MITRQQAIDWSIQGMASVLTLVGMYVGSTTPAGVAFYSVSAVFWYALSIRLRAWGLMPLNVASTALCALNYWRLQ